MYQLAQDEYREKKKLGTQKQRVLTKLDRDGFITRNECLNQIPRITRLSAIIQDLEGEGCEFDAGWYKEDYKYKLIKKNGITPLMIYDS